MAKGRKLTTSRSERYLGSFGGHGAATAASELREEDVWSVVDDGDREWGSFASIESNRSFSSYRRRATSSPPSENLQVGGLSLAFDGSGNTVSQRIVHQFRPQEESPRIASSAPVNVPDWSKIYRVDSVETLHELEDGLNDSEVVPPHEYLARSRNMAANSVFEGVGRTLKGRDMSRVRDAVWSQTGFDG